MKELKDFAPDSSSDISDAELLGDVLGRYKGMTEPQLMAELTRLVSESRADGTFSDESLLSFVELVSPQLSDSQRAKLADIVSSLSKE